MPQSNPSLLNSPVVMPRPVTGFRRQVQAIHPAFGTLHLLTTDVNISENPTPNFTRYLATPVTGPKQKAIHTAGIEEITWSIGGEVTTYSLGLLNLMSSAARGVNLTSLFIQQGLDNYFFNNANGFSLPWASLSLSGNQNSSVTFTLEGRSTQPATTGSGFPPLTPDTPIPSWFTGNNFVLSWTLSHTVNLTPNWANTIATLPTYYRAGDSEFSIQVTTSVVLEEYTLIRFGYGGITIAEGLVTSRNRVFGDKNSPVTYQVTSTNSAIASQANAYNAFINVLILGPPNGSSYN